MQKGIACEPEVFVHKAYAIGPYIIGPYVIEEYVCLLLQLLKEIEKPMMDFKEGQKKERKEVRTPHVVPVAHAHCYGNVLLAPANYREVSEAGTGTGCQH